ncbi:MAG: hypothetical protein AAF632_28180, partial [Bacteroidota bacterium]
HRKQHPRANDHRRRLGGVHRKGEVSSISESSDPMIVLATVLFLLSIGCFYAVSGRVEFQPRRFMTYFTEHPVLTRVLGWFLTIIGLVLFARELGLAKGIFLSLVLWPSLASLIVLFAPFLNKTKAKN